MADKFYVGNVGKKDKYMVGQNGKDIYKVGGGAKSGVSESNSSTLNGGDQDSPAGKKSGFSYPKDNSGTYKDIGDKADNMNYGGGSVMGISKDEKFQAGGDSSMVLAEKGSADDQKNAMSRRKAQIDSEKYLSSNELDSPVDNFTSIKK